MFPQRLPVKVFYSYSHNDETLRAELEKQLALLRRRNLISTWHDRKIEAGTDWADEISTHLETADVILLLISADFMASDYAYEIELRRAMQRHEQGSARVIPIILRDVDWTGAPFAGLQVLPTGARPVMSWSNRDEAFADISRGIRAIIENPVATGASVKDDGHEHSLVQANIPRLLPYLCNRSEQERDLTSALQQHQSVKPRRPFICVIHGNEDECHTEFLERVGYAAIPRTLNLEARQVSLEEYQYQWPSGSLSSHRYQRVFASNLGMALIQNTAATPEEVIKYIANHEKPIFLVSHLLTEDFLDSGVDLFRQFLTFWNAWPNLPPGRTVMNCVCIKHQRFNLSGLLHKWKMKRVNARLLDYINNLDLSAYEGLSGVVLPELKAIRRTDVEAWCRSKEVRKRCQIEEKDIRELYYRTELINPEGLISMEVLADELRALASKSQHHRE